MCSRVGLGRFSSLGVGVVLRAKGAQGACAFRGLLLAPKKTDTILR